MTITVCWKWVSVDGDDADARWAGVSPADEAALEIALTMRGEAGDGEVIVVTAGPPESESALREALACGADRVVRLDALDAASADVARALAEIARGSDYVLCGDYSLDRGTGSVPAFLAGQLGAAQALGLVDVDAASRPLRVVRRLDGGRREILDVPAPAVLSVEGSVARLRRATLAASLASQQATINRLPGPPTTHSTAIVAPFRPRARTLPPPSGDTLSRVRDILDLGGADAGHAETLTLEPPAAARRILDQLREWGYLG